MTFCNESVVTYEFLHNLTQTLMKAPTLYNIYPRFQIVSDLHIEALYASGKTVRDILTPSAKFLIIAGDLGRVENGELYVKALKELCSMFQKVILVAGNHEYYSMNPGPKITIEDVDKILWGLIKTPGMENLIFLNNETVNIDGILIHGATFWSYCPFQYYKNLPLYRDCGHGPRLLKVAEFNRMHLQAVESLENTIQYANQENLSLLVVTHYAPSFRGTLAPKHVYDPIAPAMGNHKNYMYCSSSDHLVENSSILSWVYGHTSHNGNIGKLVSNQLDKSTGISDAVLTLKPRYVPPPAMPAPVGITTFLETKISTEITQI